MNFESSDLRIFKHGSCSYSGGIRYSDFRIYFQGVTNSSKSLIVHANDAPTIQLLSVMAKPAIID